MANLEHVCKSFGLPSVCPCIVSLICKMGGKETDIVTVSPESCGPKLLFVSWLEMLCRQVAEKCKVLLRIKFSSC